MAVSKDELVLEIGFSLSAQPLLGQFQYYRASVVQTSLSVSLDGHLEQPYSSISVIKAKTLASFPRASSPCEIENTENQSEKVEPNSSKHWISPVAQ